MFLRKSLQLPLLKVPPKCGRIPLTTYLTTMAKSLTEYPGLAKFGIAPGLGPGDRGFKSRSPDQNRQFSVRKLAVLTFLKRLFFVYSSVVFESAFHAVHPFGTSQTAEYRCEMKGYTNSPRSEYRCITCLIITRQNPAETPTRFSSSRTRTSHSLLHQREFSVHAL